MRVQFDSELRYMFTLKQLESQFSTLVLVTWNITNTYTRHYVYLSQVIWHNMLISNIIIVYFIKQAAEIVLTTNVHPQSRLVFSLDQDSRQGIIITDGFNIPLRNSSVIYDTRKLRMLLCMGSPIPNHVSAAEVSAVVFSEGHSKRNSFSQIWKTIHKY